MKKQNEVANMYYLSAIEYNNTWAMIQYAIKNSRIILKDSIVKYVELAAKQGNIFAYQLLAHNYSITRDHKNTIYWGLKFVDSVINKSDYLMIAKGYCCIDERIKITVEHLFNTYNLLCDYNGGYKLLNILLSNNIDVSYSQMAKVYCNIKNYQKAKEYYELAKDTLQNKKYMACCINCGDYKNVIRLFENETFNNFHKYRQYYLIIGDMHYLQHNFEKSMSYYKQFLEITPRYHKCLGDDNIILYIIQATRNIHYREIKKKNKHIQYIDVDIKYQNNFTDKMYYDIGYYLYYNYYVSEALATFINTDEHYDSKQFINHIMNNRSNNIKWTINLHKYLHKHKIYHYYHKYNNTILAILLSNKYARQNYHLNKYLLENIIQQLIRSYCVSL
jgi:tetratricopeptide (TPR) repeat protein